MNIFNRWKPISTAPKDGTYILVCGPLWPYYLVTCWHFFHGWGTHIGPTNWKRLPGTPFKKTDLPIKLK